MVRDGMSEEHAVGVVERIRAGNSLYKLHSILRSGVESVAMEAAKRKELEPLVESLKEKEPAFLAVPSEETPVGPTGVTKMGKRRKLN